MSHFSPCFHEFENVLEFEVAEKSQKYCNPPFVLKMISLAKNFMMNKSKIEETLVQGENKRKFQLHNVPYSNVFMPAVCENPFQNNEYICIYIYIYIYI